MSGPVASLDRTDLRILKQLNIGNPVPGPLEKNRIERLLGSGCIAETNFGEVIITVRGQLELARWRFRHLPKTRVAFSGPRPRDALVEKFFSFRRKTV